VIEWLTLFVTVFIGWWIVARFPDREDEADDRWTRADLSKVPYVIERHEPKGHVLPWYRRVLRRAPPPEEAPRELTTYRS
jgi:hypothetical protein